MGATGDARVRAEHLGIGQEQFNGFVIPPPHLDAAVLVERDALGPAVAEPFPPPFLLDQPQGVFPGRLRIPYGDGPAHGSSLGYPGKGPY